MLYRLQYRAGNRLINGSLFLRDIDMEIFQKRGRWCFYTAEGLIQRFSTKQEAESAAGLLPTPEVTEYNSLEEAMADQGTDDLDRYEDELIAEDS